MDIIQRYWSKVERRGPDDCWPWKAGVDKKGYGRFRIKRNGKNGHIGAHRFAYILTYGDLPDSKVACHSCDNPPCCNPGHLFAGTHKENMHDSIRKGRNSPPPPFYGKDHWYARKPERMRRGENHAQAKFTYEQVRAIRLQYNTGEYSLSQLGAIYEVNRSCIFKIIHFESYRDV